MDITWYGHSCFRIMERGQMTVVTDPYTPQIGLPELKIKADVVTISHDEPGHNGAEYIKGQQAVLAGPGEYEIGGVFVYGIALHHIDKAAGIARPNVAYMMSYSGLTVLHMGDLSHIPEQSTIEEFGEVNVLLLPVGGGNSLRAGQAAEVVTLVEPNYIVPMHYALPGLNIELEPVEKFIKAMGVSKVQEEDTLRVTSSNLPEQSQVVLLTPKIEN